MQEPCVEPYDFRDAENADGIAESSHKNWILQFNAECHRMCQSLDESKVGHYTYITSRYGLVFVNITPQKSI